MCAQKRLLGRVGGRLTILKQLRVDKNIDLAGTTNTGDSEWVITDLGRDRADAACFD